MDKFKDLLSKMGASEELITQFCEELESYKSRTEDGLKREYAEKCEKARALCFEEVEAEKARLARKVEIFLETKVSAVESSAKKRIAIEEAEAANTLKAVKLAVEGVDVSSNDGGNQAALVKQEAQMKALKTKVKALNEEKDRAKKQASDATKMARRVLANNRVLEGKLKAKGATVAESKRKGKATLTESRKSQSAVSRDSTQTTISRREKADPEIAAIVQEMEKN